LGLSAAATMATGSGNFNSTSPLTPFASDRHKFQFNLEIPNRIYHLAADTEGEMSKWISCLCQICGIKSTQSENQGKIQLN
jgi:hypothetical protein